MGRQLVRFVDAQLKFDSKLVKFVKQHQHLFDRDHKLFNDGKTRIETFKHIAKQLGETEIYCEKRWVYIINRFYDEILFMLKYSTASLWLLFPQLDFLGDYIEWNDIEDICNNTAKCLIADISKTLGLDIGQYKRKISRNEIFEFNETALEAEPLPLG